MELLVSVKLAHLKFHGIPWSSMELLVSGKLGNPNSMEFHGTARNWRNLYSMELLLVSSKLAQSYFHGIPWNCSCHRNWRTSSSIEFHGNPWSSSCLRDWHPPSSMEFHGIPWNCSCQWNGALEVPWNSMEFHGIARVSEIGAPQNPWNSMEPLVSSKLAEF